MKISRVSGLRRHVFVSSLIRDPPGALLLALPPWIIAYAAREARSQRRLSDFDENWICQFLESKTRKRNFEFLNISFSSQQSLSAQVNSICNVGFLIGVHGANLANSMLMKGGSALFEIFPNQYVKHYYSNGGNSGLRYSSHEISLKHENRCNSMRRGPLSNIIHRDVLLNLTSQDRLAIIAHIQTVWITSTLFTKTFPLDWFR